MKIRCLIGGIILCLAFCLGAVLTTQPSGSPDLQCGLEIAPHRKMVRRGGTMAFKVEGYLCTDSSTALGTHDVEVRLGPCRRVITVQVVE